MILLRDAHESDLNNVHNLALYFVLLCFKRLEAVYIAPLELTNDIDFFFRGPNYTFRLVAWPLLAD